MIQKIIAFRQQLIRIMNHFIIRKFVLEGGCSTPPIGWMCEAMAVSAEEKLADQWIWQVQLLNK